MQPRHRHWQAYRIAKATCLKTTDRLSRYHDHVFSFSKSLFTKQRPIRLDGRDWREVVRPPKEWVHGSI